jgi:hypothetical protein
LGTIGLPLNQKEASAFVQKYVLGEHFTRITGNQEEQITNLSVYNKESLVGLKAAIQISSLFSTAAVGVNLPRHFFLYLSLDNYLPSNFQFQWNKTSLSGFRVPTNDLVKLRSILQLIGRLTRKTDIERKTPGMASRILFLPNPCEHQGGFFVTNPLSKMLAENFKATHTFDLSNLEDLVMSIHNSAFIKKQGTVIRHHEVLPAEIYGALDLKCDTLIVLWVNFIMSILVRVRIERGETFSDLTENFLFKILEVYQKLLLLKFLEKIFKVWDKKTENKIPTFLSYKAKIKLLRTNPLLSSAYFHFDGPYEAMLQGFNKKLNRIETEKDLFAYTLTLYKSLKNSKVLFDKTFEQKEIFDYYSIIDYAGI